MFGRLMPQEGRFFEMFIQHAGHIIEANRELVKLMADVNDGQEAIYNIESCEKRGDKIAHDVIELLHKTFITPIDRDDIHAADHADGRHPRPHRGRRRSAIYLYDLRDDHAGGGAARRDLRRVRREGPRRGVAAAEDGERGDRFARPARHRPARIRGRPRDARGDGEAVPRRAGRPAADQAEERSTSCSRRSPIAARTWRTSSKGIVVENA